MAKRAAVAKARVKPGDKASEDGVHRELTVIVPEETEPDHRLVDAAAEFIRDAIRRTVQRGFHEIGEYLFHTFFGDDPRAAQSKSPNKGASFRALLERCDTLDLPLKRTALYNAVAVAAMHRQLGSGAFKQLPQSHQIALLPVRDPRKVERLATRALSRKLPVRVLMDEVAAERAANPPEGEKRGRKPDPTLLRALKAATGAFAVEGRLRHVTRAQVEELSHEQRKVVREMAERLMGVLEGVVGKVV